MKKIDLQPSSLPVPPVHYVPGTRKGSLVFTAGQVAVDTHGDLVGRGDVKAQTRKVLENVKAVLEEGGATLGDVMKTTVFLSNISDFPWMNEVYAEFFGDLKHARSTVQAALVRPEYLVEIEAVAAVGD